MTLDVKQHTLICMILYTMIFTWMKTDRQCHSDYSTITRVSPDLSVFSKGFSFAKYMDCNIIVYIQDILLSWEVCLLLIKKIYIFQNYQFFLSVVDTLCVLSKLLDKKTKISVICVYDFVDFLTLFVNIYNCPFSTFWYLWWQFNIYDNRANF